MKYKHFTFCVFFCFVLLFVVLGAASLRPCIFSHPSTRMVLRNFGIRIPPSQVTLYQTVCIWLLHFFLLGGNSIASKSPWTNSDLRSSRQLEENTEDKTEAGVKNPRTLCLTLWSYYSRQWSLVITTVRIRIFRTPCGAMKDGWNSVAVLYDLWLMRQFKVSIVMRN